MQTKPVKMKPNAKCHCNSGKKYKKCCRSIDLKKLKNQTHVATQAELVAQAAVADPADPTTMNSKKGGGTKNTASTKAVRSGGGGMGARVRSHTSGGNSSR
jgi:uncharacterized protein YecA (UPF0149 family)